MTRAAIIAIGSEMLSPLRQDTNSLWLTARLEEVGIPVVRKSIVPDDPEAIERVRPGWHLIGYDLPVGRTWADPLGTMKITLDSADATGASRWTTLPRRWRRCSARPT